MDNFKGAIFDLDGTLLDSLDIWYNIDVKFLKKYNLPLDKDYIDKVKIMDFEAGAKYTIDRFKLNKTQEDIINEWNDMCTYSYEHEIILKPNAYSYLCKLKDSGIKLGVATALTPSLCKSVLKNNNIYHFFDSFSCTSEVGVNKGEPDIYLLAANKLNLTPSDCIVFEDIYLGIQGAKKGGFKTCGVYDSASENEKNKIMNISDYYIHDFKELL